MDEKRRQSDKDIGVIMTKLDFLITEVTDIKKNIKECYVTKIEFDPIKRLVFGAVGLILVAFVGAIIALVVNR